MRQIVCTFWNEKPTDAMHDRLSEAEMGDVPCGYWIKAARKAGWLNSAECLDLISRGSDPNSFYLVSEERNKEAEQLLTLGVQPLICLSFESPLYVPEFYGDTEWRSRFIHDWCPMPFVPKENYDFLADNSTQNQTNVGGACAFASGKSFFELRGPWDHSTFCGAIGDQLLLKRWMTYYSYAKNGDFHLYGNGWTPRQIPGLPSDFWDVITPCIKPPSPYSHKFEQMRNHDLVVSVENWGAYNTEKAFDAPMAGVPHHYIGGAHPKMDSIVDRIHSIVSH